MLSKAPPPLPRVLRSRRRRLAAPAKFIISNTRLLVFNAQPLVVIHTEASRCLATSTSERRLPPAEQPHAVSLWHITGDLFVCAPDAERRLSKEDAKGPGNILNSGRV